MNVDEEAIEDEEQPDEQPIQGQTTLNELKLGIFNLVFTMLQIETNTSSFNEAKKTVKTYLEDIINTIEQTDATN